MNLYYILPVLAAFLSTCHSLSTSDFTQDGDVPQSGYSSTHNFDPASLSTFKVKWTSNFNNAEYFYAKPLVYTPAGASNERVYVVSNQNIVRVLDGLTGVVLASRTLDPPFQSSDSDCGDIPNTIGIIGTPIIDTATELMYFWSKGYLGGRAGGQGLAKGEWKLYALKLSDLSDANGFPISIQGLNAHNDRSRYIVGGTLNQRPGLAMIGNIILTAFGSHCDNFNYTGYLIAASKTPGVGITDIQATAASPGAPNPQDLDLDSQNNGKAGIWQSGIGLSVDAPTNRVYFSVGNGRGAGQLKSTSGVPTSGKVYLSTLENSVVSYSVDPTAGTLSQLDWFCPTNYDSLNGGDRDVGSSGVSLLDANPFSGGGVNRIAIAAGKSGIIFIMDANDLGGFKNGPNQSDNLLQTISMSGAFFGGIASYPLEGGYIYFVPSGGSLYAYRFGIVDGKPKFTFAGKTAMTFAGKGAPMVTSLRNKPGTGIVWLSDVNQGVVAYNAIPVDGVLQPYAFPKTGRLNKFHRPSFGNSKVYTAENNGILGIGGDTAPPLSIISTSSVSSATTATSTSKSNTSIPSRSISLASSSTSLQSSSSAISTSTKSTSAIISTTATSIRPTSSALITPSSAISSSSISRINSSKTSDSLTTSTSTSRSSSSSPTSSSSTFSTSTYSLTSSTTATRTSSSIPAAYTTPAPPKGRRTTVNWELTWVNAAPDGVMRPMIGINGQWPNPPIVLNYGDTLVLNIHNSLGNESTSLHWHGIFQKETNFEDGSTFTTQCPIPPGSSFVYQFDATQIGTFWYHSHHNGQYIDGLRGPLIINDPSPPYGQVDQDIILTLSDHYHEEAPYLINYYQSVDNTNKNGGAEPVPDANLMNDAQNVKFFLVPGKTNLFRIINMGAVAGQYIQFDQHTMTIVEVDGQYVQPYEVQQLFIAVAQRYSVLIRSKNDATSGGDQNYAIVATMDTMMFEDNSAPAQPTVTGWLVYNTGSPLPEPFALQTQSFCDTNLVPLDQQKLLDPPARTIYMSAEVGVDENGITRGYLSGVTFVSQRVPTLYTALTAPSQYLNNRAIYGTGSNPTVLPFGTIIEIDITNHDDRAHPFHLHGHAFQVIYRSDGGDLFPGLYDTPNFPLKRDVITVYGQGTAIIRFVADNPGIQLFHCHTEWHVISGMMATLIEAPTELVASKPYIPASHRSVCDVHGIPRKGNAAGNSKSWLDLNGAATQAPIINWGALDKPLP